jgi:hypothetical protein
LSIPTKKSREKNPTDRGAWEDEKLRLCAGCRICRQRPPWHCRLASSLRSSMAASTLRARRSSPRRALVDGLPDTCLTATESILLELIGCSLPLKHALRHGASTMRPCCRWRRKPPPPARRLQPLRLANCGARPPPMRAPRRGRKPRPRACSALRGLHQRTLAGEGLPASRPQIVARDGAEVQLRLLVVGSRRSSIFPLVAELPR